MFPLSPSTITLLVFIGVVLFSAFALRTGWRWRLPFLLLAISLPTGLFWFYPQIGDYAVVGYIVVGGASFALLILGAGLGSVMRLTHVGPLKFVAVLAIAAFTCASFVLWHQYLPDACLGAPLEIRVADKTLHLPPELRPRLENGDNIRRFGRIDRKSAYSSLCRESRNGTQAIEMDTVWITPASNHTAMTLACNAIEPPAWCGGYSPNPYRHIIKVLIAPEIDPVIPLAYWLEGGSLKKDRQGDLRQGSVCLLPNAEIKTQCWVWQPFGNGSRLTISTNNQDPIFEGMPVEEARDLLRRARDITLAVIAR